MNKVLRYFLLTVGYNLGAALLLFAPLLVLNDDQSFTWLFIILFITPISLLVQFIVGIAYAVGKKNPDLGQGMLLAIGFFLLVGLSICTPVLMNL